MLRIHDETVPDDLAALLGVPDNTVVTRLDRLRLADDIPVALDWTWLPPRFGRLLKGEDLGARTIYEVIESDYGIPILYGEYTIEACLAGEDQAQLLAIIPNAPVLLVSRTSYTIHNRIVYHQRRFYRADRVKYWVRLDRTDSPSDPMESSSPVLDDAK
jgi:GntR family transcriptional regulator